MRARFVLLAAVAAAVLAIAPVFTPLPFAYRDVALHVSVETAAGLIALLTAQLAFGRFRRTLQLRDLLLTAALWVLAATNLLLAVGLAVTGDDVTRVGGWAPVAGRIAGAALFAAAALVTDRVEHRPARATATAAASSILLLGLFGGAIALARDALPAAVAPDAGGGSLDGVRGVREPLELVAQLTMLAAYAAAAWGLGRRAARHGDVLLRWLTLAALLGALARVDYLLFPSLDVRWFYLGDVIRFFSFVAVLVGALAELSTIQAELRAAAAQEERRRLARDLHDGVAQDLAFILQFGRHLVARGESAPALERLVAAAQGALDESRHAISTLRRAPGLPLSEALVLTAREIAEREGGEIRASVDPGVSVPRAAEEALLRITREATVNAFRHGAARRVHIELSVGQSLRLAITDDGRGFEVPPAGAAPGRLGLLTMRERAEEVGAELSIVSAPGRGTRIEVSMR